MESYSVPFVIDPKTSPKHVAPTSRGLAECTPGTIPSRQFEQARKLLGTSTTTILRIVFLSLKIDDAP